MNKHQPTQSPTIQHGKVSHSPTAKPNGKADDDSVYTFDDQVYYGDTVFEETQDSSSTKKSKKSSKKSSNKSSKKSSKKSSDKKTSSKTDK